MQKLPDLPVTSPVTDAYNRRITATWERFLRELVVRAGGYESLTIDEVTGSSMPGLEAAVAALEVAVEAASATLTALEAVQYLVAASSPQVPSAVTVTAAGLALLSGANAAAQRTTLGLSSMALQAAGNVAITGGSVTGITDLALADGGTGASDVAGARTNLGLVPGTDVQPYDADLTTIATNITAFGHSLIDDANAAAARTTLGLVIGTDVQAFDADLSTMAASVTAQGLALLDDADAVAQRTTLGLGTMAEQAASAVAITGGTISGITDLAVADGGTGASTASAARTNLGLVIGTDVQAFDADLTTLAATITAAGMALLDDADATAQRTTLGLGTMATQAASGVAITGGTISGITDLAVADGGTGASTAAAARTNLGLVIGTDVQAYDADLATLAATITAAGHALLDDASAAAQRTTLGLGTLATQAAESVAITGGQVTDLSTLETLNTNPLFERTDGTALTVFVDTATGVAKNLSFRVGGLQRWLLSCNADAESGSNVGSNFQLTRRNDDGTVLSTVLRIERSTGNVGINVSTNTPSALLELSSTTKGLLLPRLTSTQRDAISVPPAGLLIYNSTTGKLNVRGSAAWEAVTSA